MGDLQNALAPIVNGLISTDNLELAQFQADTLSTAGQLLAFGGLNFGGAVIGAITTLIALIVIVASNEGYQRIDRERFSRITTTTTPSPDPPTIITCDAGFFLMGGACQGKSIFVKTSINYVSTSNASLKYSRLNIVIFVQKH